MPNVIEFIKTPIFKIEFEVVTFQRVLLRDWWMLKEFRGLDLNPLHLSLLSHSNRPFAISD